MRRLRRLGVPAPRAPRMKTAADIAYEKMLSEGYDKKTAAKYAQDLTGLSVVTGRLMKSRGYGRTYK